MTTSIFQNTYDGFQSNNFIMSSSNPNASNQDFSKRHSNSSIISFDGSHFTAHSSPNFNDNTSSPTSTTSSPSEDLGPRRSSNANLKKIRDVSSPYQLARSRSRTHDSSASEGEYGAGEYSRSASVNDALQELNLGFGMMEGQNSSLQPTSDSPFHLSILSNLPHPPHPHHPQYLSSAPMSLLSSSTPHPHPSMYMPASGPPPSSFSNRHPHHPPFPYALPTHPHLPPPTAFEVSLDSTLENISSSIKNSITTSAQDKGRQQFVQSWLHGSYVVFNDGNVSRQGLYGSYLKVCERWEVKPINSASFGKAVRQAFPNIKTRRLGVRGNSKYHYCGIRPSNPREAEILTMLSRSDNDANLMGGNNQGMGFSGSSGGEQSEEEDMDVGNEFQRQMSAPAAGGMTFGLEISPQVQPSSINSKPNQLSLPNQSSTSEFPPETPTTARPKILPDGTVHFPSKIRKQPSVGFGKMSGVPPVPSHSGSVGRPVNQSRTIHFPSLDDLLNSNTTFSASVNHSVAHQIWSLYADHCQNLLESIREFRFDQFELHIRSFWNSLDEERREVIGREEMGDLVCKADSIVYDEILEYLHSTTMEALPPMAFSQLRGLADNMEQIIIVSLTGFNQSFVGPKIELAARFGHLIVRHLGICQLGQALHGIISNSNSVKQLVVAWDTIDFESVRNQAALVTNCNHDLLTTCFQDFKGLLQLSGPNLTVQTLINWVDSTYSRCIHPLPGEERTSIPPRSLLVRWNYVSTQILRDLTLKSSPAFGSFQIVALFFEEWLAFTVLRKVALTVGGNGKPSANSSNAQVSTALSSNVGPVLNGFATSSSSPAAPQTSQSQSQYSSLTPSGTDDFFKMPVFSPTPLFSPGTQALFDTTSFSAPNVMDVETSGSNFSGFSVVDAFVDSPLIGVGAVGFGEDGSANSPKKEAENSEAGSTEPKAESS